MSAGATGREKREVSFADAQTMAWANKQAKGFNTSDVPLEVCLLQGEMAEFFDAWRKQTGTHGEELADVAIFLLGLAEMTGVDLGAEVAAKVTINAARTYRRVNDAAWQKVSP